MIRAQSSEKTTSKRLNWSLLLVLLFGLLAALPIVSGQGMINTRAGGDSPFLLQRVYEMSQSLADGEFPVRWMAGAAQGLGYPFYNYYAALPYYIASTLNLMGLGVIGGIQATQILGFLIAAVATYALILELGHKRPAAVAASAIYTFAPFHLINIYVRGDSLSEFYAMALFPIILYAALRLEKKPSFWTFCGLAASFAALMLSHNISAMLFAPLVAMWILVQALRSEKNWRTLSLGAGALLLGLALSAWFWVPALWEQPLVQLTDQTTGYFDFRGHLTNTFVQPSLIHDYTITANQDPFAMGGVEAVLGILGIIATIGGMIKQHKADGLNILILITTLGYTWLMTSSSLIVWENLPLLSYTQFPWRLLSVQALGIALLVPNLFELLRDKWQWAWGIAIAALVSFAGMGGLDLDYLPITETDVTAEQLQFYEAYSGNTGTTIRNEYLPADFVPRPQTSAVALGDETISPLVLEGVMSSAELVERDSTTQTWRITIEEKVLLAFNTTFFSGWEAVVDGQTQGIEPLAGLGLCGLRLDPGSHEVTLYFANSTVRNVAEWASLVALIVLAALLTIPCIKNRKQRNKLLVGLGAGAIIVVWAALTPFIPQTEALEGARIADFSRAPYLHAEPEGVFFGEARLVDYSYNTTTLQPGEALQVLLDWESSEDAAYTVELSLVSTTAHLYEPAPIWAQVSGALVDDMLILTLPDELAPGTYVIRLRVLQDGQAVAVTTADGVEMSTPVLTPIQVTMGGSLSEAEAIGQYGPESKPIEISLLGVTAERHDASTVTIEMTWRSERQATLNYMLSVRLKQTDGTILASRDLPPLLGCYPTSLWLPLDTFADRVPLSVDGELTPGTYTVEVVLYNRLTLQGAGVTTVEIELE